MQARLLLDTKTVLVDGRIVERRVWQLPTPTAERPHGIKYRLYCGRNGKTIVRYDNETGRGDHRHVGPTEIVEPYTFTTLHALLTDFVQDIESLSGEIT